MIRKKKAYVRPKKLYEKSRIDEENAIALKYGLKNKREIWKTIAKVDYFRRRAKDLAKASAEEQQILFNKLKAIGLKIETIADVLALKIENLLERRLPTIVYKKGLAKTTKHARQLVVHKKVLINNKVNNTPSYLVLISEEDSVAIKPSSKKPKVEKTQSPSQSEAPVEAKAEEVAQ